MSGKPLNLERRIYIDTNVFINYYRGDKSAKEAIKHLFRLQNYELYTSVLSIAQTIATLQSHKLIKAPRQSIIDFIRKLAPKVKFIGCANNDIEAAFELPNNDLEDNLQYVLGSKARCYFYVTDNIRDYKYNAISAVKPTNVYTIGL